LYFYCKYIFSLKLLIYDFFYLFKNAQRGLGDNPFLNQDQNILKIPTDMKLSTDVHGQFEPNDSNEFYEYTSYCEDKVLFTAEWWVCFNALLVKEQKPFEFIDPGAVGAYQCGLSYNFLGTNDQCGLCEGPCRYDTDCAGSMICRKHKDVESIKQCKGMGEYNVCIVNQSSVGFDIFDRAIELVFGKKTTIGQICAHAKDADEDDPKVAGFCCLDAPYESVNWGEMVRNEIVNREMTCSFYSPLTSNVRLYLVFVH